MILLQQSAHIVRFDSRGKPGDALPWRLTLRLQGGETWQILASAEAVDPLLGHPAPHVRVTIET